ncbi:MAG: class I SAM-dependent methyltransferase [Thermodesulfobacteriota bacterium]
MLIYWRLVKECINWLESRQPEVRVLDCGCGHGVLSVLLAQRGVQAMAVDISQKSIEITRRLACANKVEQKVHTVVAALENLPFEDSYFDCIVGTRVLHHVDIMTSGIQLARVLKPQGLGIFWECTEKNAVLRFARKYLRRLISMPKFGTTYEHPLTKEEIDSLGRNFGKPARAVDAPFYFFSFLDQYLFRQRVKIFTKVVIGLDAIIVRYLPYMNRYSFHQILILEKRSPSNK